MTETKPTNPKDAVGISKAPLSTVSLAVMQQVGLAMMEGAMKYGRHNYRDAGVRASVYVDATFRHLASWWDFGQDIDPDSGLNHIIKAIASLTVLADGILMGNMTDDRPPKHDERQLALFNEMAAAMLAKYPNPKAAFTETGRKPVVKVFDGFAPKFESFSHRTPIPDDTYDEGY